MRSSIQISSVLFAAAALFAGACAVQPPGGDDGGGDDGGGDDGGGGDSPCTTGTLFAGNPLYAGDALAPTSGAPLLADPPVWWQGITLDGPRLYTHQGQELWGGDRSSVRRLVGSRQAGLPAFNAGACADARLAFTMGIAVLPDGSLIVADYNANAIVKVTDPQGPACAVSYYAGTAQAIGAVSPIDPPNVGNTDGVGAAARFALPLAPVADATGTVYVLDDGNHSIRKIVPSGAVGAVTTVPFDFREGEVTWSDMVLRGDKLILAGNTFGPESYVVEVDPASGAYRILVGGDSSAFPPGDADRSAVLASVATDGERVFVSGLGRIWQVTDDGDVILAAGGYSFAELFDFPFPGYDPAASHDALDLALKYVGDAQTSQWMSFDGDQLYFTARATGTGYYALAITCPR